MILLQNPPIEPIQDHFENVPDSRIDSYRPVYWPFKKTYQISHDIVPKTLPYLSIKSTQVPTYDSEFNALNVPSLISEDNYNKYYTQMYNYRKQEPVDEPDVAIQLLANTNVFRGYKLPAYQHSDNVEPIVSNVIQKEQNDVSDEEIQTFEKNPVDASKESPTVLILSLSSEPSKEQIKPVEAIEEETPINEINENEPITSTTEDKLLNMEINAIVKLVGQLNKTETKEKSTEDESVSAATTENIPTENELLVKELLTPIVMNLNKNSIEYEQNPLDEEFSGTPLEGSPVDEIDYEANELSREETSNNNRKIVLNENELNTTTPENLITTPVQSEHPSINQLSAMKLLGKEPLEISDLKQKISELKPLFLTVDNISNEFPTNLAVNEDEEGDSEYDEDR